MQYHQAKKDENSYRNAHADVNKLHHPFLQKASLSLATAPV